MFLWCFCANIRRMCQYLYARNVVSCAFILNACVYVYVCVCMMFCVSLIMPQ